MAISLTGLVFVSCSKQGANKPASNEPGYQGVAELKLESCDSYIHKFVTCVSQGVPEETKIMLLAALEQSKSQWAQALSSGMAPDIVSQSCLAALETAKQTLAQYNCSW